MRSVKLRWVAMCGLAVLAAAVAIPAAQANPPIAGATYAGTTSEVDPLTGLPLPIVLVVNSAGTALDTGSYIDFRCGDSEVTREFLDGTTLLLPAGLTNRSDTGIRNEGRATPGFNDGMLSWRFFARFFASMSSGAGGQTQPPGDSATGDFSGRNVTGIPGGEGFCSFRVTWVVKTPPPPPPPT
jgi:hypothetical protein